MSDEPEVLSSSWKPIDLGPYIDGSHNPPKPTIMRRSDGPCLLYPGKVHSFHGEPESGKSMLAHVETARMLKAGNRCLLIDFESDAATVVDRLIKCGATAEDIGHGLDYIRPESLPGPAEWKALLSQQYALVVLDGVTEAFAVFGVQSIDNDEVTRWGRTTPRVIAQCTGAAVVLIDHVVKSQDGRGRYAIGAQAKMSMLDGAAYTVEVDRPLGVGLKGSLLLRIAKDRPGQVRPHAGGWRKSDRTQPVAVAVIDSTDPERIAYSLYPPGSSDSADHERIRYDPEDDLMRHLSKALEDAGKSLNVNALTKLVTGRKASQQAALTRLREMGHVKAEPGPNRSTIYTLVHPYPYGESAGEDGPTF